MGTLNLAVDSGAHTGWALAEGLTVRSCGLCVVRDDEALVLNVPFGRVRTVREDGLPLVVGASVWVEFPRHYPNGRNYKAGQYVDPNDLIKLGARAGRVQERYLELGNRVEMIFPYDWKGQTPKHINHARTREVLTPTELAMVEQVTRGMADKKVLDVWDALGILVWVLEKEGRK